jgi:hypothetical protein
LMGSCKAPAGLTKAAPQYYASLPEQRGRPHPIFLLQLVIAAVAAPTIRRETGTNATKASRKRQSR